MILFSVLFNCFCVWRVYIGRRGAGGKEFKRASEMRRLFCVGLIFSLLLLGWRVVVVVVFKKLLFLLNVCCCCVLFSLSACWSFACTHWICCFYCSEGPQSLNTDVQNATGGRRPSRIPFVPSITRLRLSVRAAAPLRGPLLPQKNAPVLPNPTLALFDPRSLQYASVRAHESLSSLSLPHRLDMNCTIRTYGMQVVVCSSASGLRAKGPSPLFLSCSWSLAG